MEEYTYSSEQGVSFTGKIRWKFNFLFDDSLLEFLSIRMRKWWLQERGKTIFEQTVNIGNLKTLNYSHLDHLKQYNGIN